ncbi:nodulation protein NodH [Thioclava sp. BHET1]|nr:nodulation protein NodH [Thioclava sp. BHET1]
MADFDYFVILASMRTGSNLLEETLNSFDGITCFGEAFNPAFLGHRGHEEMLGVTRAGREEDPMALVRAMIAAGEGLTGFRLFHDHDPRVLAACLMDPRCAKVVLSRNPAESYVSLQIARQTGQWKLGNLKNQKQAQAHFDTAEFETYLEEQQGYHLAILNSLQRSGQTAFYLDYEDLAEVDVLNGLAAFLGVAARIEEIPTATKKQNPEPISEKVGNAAEMEQALTRLDRFNLSRTPNFEPRRGPGVPAFVAATGAPLLYMPIRFGPELPLRGWLSALGQGEELALGAGLEEGFSQKSLRQWKRDNPGFRSFTVLRHPVARAHAFFCEAILAGRFPELRRHLRKLFKVQLPEDPMDRGYDRDSHRAGFLALLRFLKANLSGQTGIGVNGAWASQMALLQGFAVLGGPDLVIREERLLPGLAYLAAELGLEMPTLPPVAEIAPHRLADIYDEEVEQAAREAYLRDYSGLGFDRWGA